MTIHQLTVPFAITSLVLSVGAPILAFFLFSRYGKLSWKAIAIGGATWFIATQVLEKMFHGIVITYTPLFKHPYLFAVYGAFAAGIFEECARYIAYTKYLKGKREWKDGAAYGVGHGGLESIMLGLLGGTQILTFVSMIQKGSFSQLKGKVPPEIINQIQTTLQSSPFVFLLGGIERVFAFILQVFLSVVVLYAVKYGKAKFLLYAILLHALFNLAPALYQMGVLPLVYAEVIVAAFAVMSGYFLYNWRKQM